MGPAEKFDRHVDRRSGSEGKPHLTKRRDHGDTTLRAEWSSSTQRRKRCAPTSSGPSAARSAAPSTSPGRTSPPSNARGAAEFSWDGFAGTGAVIASAIRGWEHLRFEVTEDPTSASLGGRWMHTPDLGVHHSHIDAAGSITVSEERVRAAMDHMDPLEMRRELDIALGTACGTASSRSSARRAMTRPSFRCTSQLTPQTNAAPGEYSGGRVHACASSATARRRCVRRRPRRHCARRIRTSC